MCRTAANCKNIVPSDPIKDIQVNAGIVTIATAYYFINSDGDNPDSPNRIALASMIIDTWRDERILETYIANECRKVYPEYLDHEYPADSHYLSDFDIRILRTTVLVSEYIAAGYSLTGITVHKNIHDYIRMIELDVSVNLDLDCKPTIRSISIRPVPEDHVLGRRDLDYVHIHSSNIMSCCNQFNRYVNFICLCNLKDISPENYTKTIEEAINGHLRHHVIPYFYTIINKLSPGI